MIAMLRKSNKPEPATRVRRRAGVAATKADAAVTAPQFETDARSRLHEQHGHAVRQCPRRARTAHKLAAATLRRNDLLSTANARLKLEIVRHKAMEAALRATRDQQSRLLKQSHLQQKQLRDLSRGMLKAQEEERKRISRELHDVIAQTLVGINVHLATLTQDAATKPVTLRRRISLTRRLVENAILIVHDFTYELRTTLLDDLGLIPALQTYLHGFMTDTGIRVSLKAYARIEQASATVRTALYRIAQEALNNVARHAKASRVDVSLELHDDTICMQITDNGQGFTTGVPARSKKSGGLGLLGMRERAEMIGGTLRVDSAAGGPTTVQVRIAAGKARTRKPAPPPPGKPGQPGAPT